MKTAETSSWQTDSHPELEIPLPPPTDQLAQAGEPSTELARPDPTLGEALHDVAHAGQDLLVDRLELFKVEVTESVKEHAQKAKTSALEHAQKAKASALDQVEKVKTTARERIDGLKVTAREQGARIAERARVEAVKAGALAGAGVVLLIGWGLLCAAAVVALAHTKVGVAGALAIVSLPHIAIGIALLVKGMASPRTKRG
jgi:hypothetical protein